MRMPLPYGLSFLYYVLLWKLPTVRNNEESYPAVMTMNQNDQPSKILLKVQQKWQSGIDSNQELYKWAFMVHSTGGKWGLVLETYPTTWNTEVVGLRGEPTTATLVEQHNSEISSKCLSLYPQVSPPPTPHQRSCFSLQMETITENHNCSKETLSDIFHGETWIDINSS